MSADDPRPGQALILLVDDNEDDVLITRRAFARGHVSNPVVVAHDGDEALDRVFGRGRFQGQPRPALVILDLNLPTVDGFTVLETIKRDPEACAIPVIVLTTSKRREDVLRSYRAHANSYLEKPVEFERFVRVVASWNDYWNHTATLPPAVEPDDAGDRAA